MSTEHAATGGAERVRRHRRRRTRRRPCTTDTPTTADGGSFRFSDTSEDEYHSWRSSMGSFAGVGEEEENEEELDLEMGKLKEEVVPEKDCRICHLSLMGNGISDDVEGNEGNAAVGIGIELGCSCKGDLGNAHKQCAETWFKIKGDTTCEICDAIAINIAGEQAPDISIATTAAAPPAAMALSERQNYCRGRRIMNFLLACMIFAFVISWLFHFNVLS